MKARFFFTSIASSFAPVLSLAFALSFGLATGLSLTAQAQTASPVGLWKTIDDKTGQPRTIVRIEAKGEELQGFIHQRLDPNAKPDAVCTACSGDRLNQPIQGLNLIRGLKANPKDSAVWEGGTILDPENGSEYRLRVKLIDGGQKLELRGYVGTPLLGRTQVWLRQPS